MSQVLSYTVMTTLSANGSTAAVNLVNSTETEVTIYSGATQTWGSGTVILQQSFDAGTTWHTVPNASWTSGAANTLLGRVTVLGGGTVRLTLSGSTTPTLNFAVKAEQVKARPMYQYTLLANGSTPVFPINDDTANIWVANKTTPDGLVGWGAQGTWGSGTLALQVSPDGSTWYNQQAGITANGVQYATGVTDLLGRFTLSGASSPSLTIYASA
jgi:hypothetical protein